MTYDERLLSLLDEWDSLSARIDSMLTATPQRMTQASDNLEWAHRRFHEEILSFGKTALD